MKCPRHVIYLSEAVGPNRKMNYYSRNQDLGSVLESSRDENAEEQLLDQQ